LHSNLPKKKKRITNGMYEVNMFFRVKNHRKNHEKTRGRLYGGWLVWCRTGGGLAGVWLALVWLLVVLVWFASG